MSVEALDEMIVAEIRADLGFAQEIADQVIARLLSRAAAIWATVHPNAAQDLVDADLATSANRFLYLAEDAVHAVVTQGTES